MAIVVFHVVHSSGWLDHAGGSLGAQLIYGTGPQLVDVLFIVSGFVVFLPTVARGGRVRERRRVRDPARCAAAPGLLALARRDAAGDGNRVRRAMPGLGGLASNFSGQQTIVSLFSPDTLIGFGPDSPVWTLTLEIGFYIVLPFIAAAYFRRPLIGLAIALAIALLWREAFAPHRTAGGMGRHRPERCCGPCSSDFARSTSSPPGPSHSPPG